jgi:hypothetical protein
MVLVEEPQERRLPAPPGIANQVLWHIPHV